MSQRMNHTVDVPAEVVVKSRGFSLDIGGSVIKLVYRTKDDYDAATAKQGKEMAKLRLTLFSRSEFNEAIQFIKQEVYMTHSDEGRLTQIYTTGVGCSQNKKTFADELKCEVNNLSEFDCFAYSMEYLLKSLTRDQLLHPLLVEATREPFEMMKGVMAKFKTLMESGLSNAKMDFDLDAINNAGQKEEGTKSDPRAIADSEDIYPYMIAMCGSAFGFLKVNKGGETEIVDGSNRGGRTFYGLATILTGCQTFDELVELATTGNRHNIDVGTHALMEEYKQEESGDTDLYSTMADDPTDSVVYCFGKGVGSQKDQFSRADLAATLLHMMVQDLAQTVHYCSIDAGCKHIFFAGSFPNAEVIRHHITTEMTRRNCMRYTVKGLGEGIMFDFVKPGGHLGALGAFINYVEHFLKDPSLVLNERKTQGETKKEEK